MTPAAAEWDFRKIPQKQRQLCYFYEYCRESEGIKKAVESFRQNGHKLKRLREVAVDQLSRRDCQSFTEWSEILDTIHRFSPLAELDEFPASPWQKISAQRRVECVKRFASELPFLGIGLRVILDPLGDDWTEWKRIQKGLDPETTVGWFAIPPGFSKQEIIQEFKKIQVPTEHKANRGGPYDFLRRLGAYRVMNLRSGGRSAAEAMRFVQIAIKQNIVPQPENKNILYGSDESDWYDAKKIAGERIAIFNEIGDRFVAALNSDSTGS